ncbi:DnaJ-like protein C11 C-terminal domain-containing protein [Plasmodiophora brassicae]
MASCLTVGAALPHLIDPMSSRAPSFQALLDGAGPASSIAAEPVVWAKRPVLSIAQSWTIAAYRRARLDIRAQSGQSVIVVGADAVIVPDDRHRIRVGVDLNNDERVRASCEIDRRINDDLVVTVGIDDTLSPVFRTGFVLDPNATVYASVSADGRLEYDFVVSKPDGPRIRLGATNAGQARVHISWPLPMYNCRGYARFEPTASEVGLSLRVNDATRLQFGIERHQESLFSVRFRFRFKHFVLSLPFAVSDEIIVVAALTIPVVVFSLSKLLQRRRGKQARVDVRTRIAAFLAVRKAALDQQDAMAAEARSRTQSERDVDGLVISSAVFYVECDDDKRQIGKEFAPELDVTIPLQFWVTGSQLHLTTAPKRDMLGFCRPFCVAGARKPAMLRVEYYWRRRLHRCTISEHEPLHLPDPRHEVIRD